jgi:hypothetical protein
MTTSPSIDISVTKKPRAKKDTSSAAAKKAAASINVSQSEIQEPEETKKRGRKPRGGKLVINPSEVKSEAPCLPNIILHLKCSSKELSEYNVKISKLITDPLEYNPDIPPTISTYNENFLSQTYSSFDGLPEQGGNTQSAQNTLSSPLNANNGTYFCPDCNSNKMIQNNEDSPSDENENANLREINTKLKHLKVQLYKNCLAQDKTSACFWCTCDYDSSPCYITKTATDTEIHGYGSFCRPECAVAYLMKENIDDSTKFERYHLLNQVYGKAYGYKKNIKPAPNPYYLLDKYYGNLTIQQYRKLLKTEHLLSVVDKPITRILPELHEDNDELIMSIYGIEKTLDVPSSQSHSAISTSGYKVKRQSERQQGPSKNSIIMQKFGLSGTSVE